jgi:hypothetical protein
MTISLSPDDLADIAGAVSDELARRALIEAKLAPDRFGYTEREAADALGVAWYTLRNVRLAGQIAAKKIGKRYIYSRSALMSYVEAEPATRRTR